MTIYTECEKCGRWTEEIGMDYFTGIGNVCPECKDELLKQHKRNQKCN